MLAAHLALLRVESLANRGVLNQIIARGHDSTLELSCDHIQAAY